MKTLLMLMLSLSSLQAFAASLEHQFQGHYSKGSAVRFFGTKEFCDAESGEYDAQERACYIFSSSGNSINIGDELVRLEAIYGAAHERSYTGQIMRVDGNVLTLREVTVSDDEETIRPVTNGCAMKVIIEGTMARNELDEDCDGGLNLRDLRRTK